MNKKNILFITSEAVPFFKVGGLGDVSLSLPKALFKEGFNVKVILPKNINIPKEFTEKMRYLGYFYVPVGWRNQYAGLFHLKYQSIDFYFIDNEYYFKRHIPYGHYDDGEIFSYFCRASLEAISHIHNFKPDFIHCNDWHTGMIPVLLNAFYRDKKLYKNIKTIFTIHNLRYQGIFPHSILPDLLGLDYSYFTEDKLKFYDCISFMKGGIIYSDLVTTVSPTYANEIKYPFFGEQLDGLIKKYSYKIHGILNGLDYRLYNPNCDKAIPFNFSSRNISKKVENKIALQKKLSLTVDKNKFMIAIVSRLVDQKGLDLIKCVFEDILKLDLQFVIIGTGDLKYEDMFRYYSRKYPEKVSANIKFDENLAREIYAGANLLLMPSLYEPCGLTQLIAMRYGTIPLVRETGGLKDTITPFNFYTHSGNGFSFSNYNAHEMLFLLEKVVALYYKEPDTWKKLIKNSMATRFDWDKSAKEYKELILCL